MIRPLQARVAAREEEIDDYEGGAEPNMKFSHALIVVLVLHVLAVGGVFAFNTLKTSHPAANKKKPPVAERQESRPVAEASEKSAPTVAAKPEAKTIPPAAGVTHTVAPGDTLTKIAAQHKTSVEAVEKANGLESTATIRVGQVLKISSKPAADSKPAAVKESAPVAKVTDTKPATKVPGPAAPGKAPQAVESAKAAPVAAPQAAKPAASPEARQETKAAASGGTYTVAKGDNPYSIAKKLKISYSELLKVNKIEDPKKLQIGQKLTIP